jgi:hypothetical protein
MSGHNGKPHIIMSALQLLFMSLRTSKLNVSLSTSNTYPGPPLIPLSAIVQIVGLLPGLHWPMSRKSRGEFVHLCFS